MGTGLDLAGISSSLRMSLTHEITGGTTTVYIFSGTKVISEYENGTAVGSPTREYIYSGTQLLATMEGSAVKYYHQDHLSNRVITDANGSVVEQKGHLPFGETWYGGGDKWKFTTYERDAESGNDYAIFRSYVNRLGRFSSPDPLAGSTTDPQSLNRYSYALNDPSNGTDPLGLFIGIPPEIPDIWWLLLMFGGGGGRHAPLLDGSEGRDGGGGGRDVNKTFPPNPSPVKCNLTASQVMQAVQANFSSFANYSGQNGYVVFSPGPLAPGQTILIDSTLNVPVIPRGFTSMTSAVVASSTSSTSFSFQTVQGQHPFYPGTITFSAAGAGNGQINFSVNVNSDFSTGLRDVFGLVPWLGFRAGGEQFEASIWRNLINNVAALCSNSGARK